MMEYRTIADEHCTDTMTRDVLGDKSIPKEFTDGENRVLHFLTGEDYFLLEDYAPKLFNTVPEPKYLLGYMYKLAIEVDKYRGAYIINEGNKQRYNNEAHPQEKKSVEYKSQQLEKDIKHLISVIDGVSFAPSPFEVITHKITLVEELKYALSNLEHYVPIKIKWANYLKNGKPTISKAPIKEYLFSLNLPNKTNEINSFITSIS